MVTASLYSFTTSTASLTLFHDYSFTIVIVSPLTLHCQDYCFIMANASPAYCSIMVTDSLLLLHHHWYCKTMVTASPWLRVHYWNCITMGTVSPWSLVDHNYCFTMVTASPLLLFHMWYFMTKGTASRRLRKLPYWSVASPQGEGWNSDWAQYSVVPGHLIPISLVKLC